jgi:hypothetical protein
VVRGYRHFAEESVKRSLIFPSYESRRGKDDHRGTGICGTDGQCVGDRYENCPSRPRKHPARWPEPVSIQFKFEGYLCVDYDRLPAEEERAKYPMRH